MSVSSSEPGAAGASSGSDGVGASYGERSAGGVGGGSIDADGGEPPKKKGKSRGSRTNTDIRNVQRARSPVA